MAADRVGNQGVPALPVAVVLEPEVQAAPQGLAISRRVRVEPVVHAAIQVVVVDGTHARWPAAVVARGAQLDPEPHVVHERHPDLAVVHQQLQLPVAVPRLVALVANLAGEVGNLDLAERLARARRCRGLADEDHVALELLLAVRRRADARHALGNFGRLDDLLQLGLPLVQQVEVARDDPSGDQEHGLPKHVQVAHGNLQSNQETVTATHVHGRGSITQKQPFVKPFSCVLP